MSDCSAPRDILVLHTDDTILGVGAAAVLASLDRFHIVSADSEVSELVPLVQRTQPRLVMLDLTPRITVGLIAALRKTAPGTRLLLWGRSLSEELRDQAPELGVAGFLRRDCSTEEFIEGVLQVAAGKLLFPAVKPTNSTRVLLTKRESQLVSLLVQGLRNKEIANCLGITEGTVRIYLSKLFVKIGARDRFELAIFGLKNAYCGEAVWDGQNGFVTESDDGRARPVLRSLVLVEPKRRRGYSEAPRASGE